MTEQVIRIDVPSFKELSASDLWVKLKNNQYIMSYIPDYSKDDVSESIFPQNY